jgi:copper(I)-binding protein
MEYFVFKKTKVAMIATLSLISALTLSSCSSDQPKLEILDPVARSIDSASYKSESTGKYMTGSFMTIKNTGDLDVTLVGGTSPDAGRIEIHEVIDGKMLPMSAGLVIPAKDEVKLRMGGYHVMLMDLNKEIKAGEEVNVTLEFSDGQSIKYTAPVKDIAMDDEVYGADMAGMDSTEMNS